MAETFNKKEREKKRELKRKEKLQKKEFRKDNSTEGAGWESMMAYVDENGVIRDTPPDPNAKKEVKAKNIEIGVPKREKEDYDPTLTGVISYFDDTKGYGFIKTANDESFFMHQNHVSGQPAKGRRVRFEKEKGAKGWVAVKVVLE